jgi:hypothetical protein
VQTSSSSSHASLSSAALREGSFIYSMDDSMPISSEPTPPLFVPASWFGSCYRGSVFFLC